MAAGSSCEPAGTATVTRTVPEPGRGHSRARAPETRVRSTGTEAAEASSPPATDAGSAVRDAASRLNDSSDTRKEFEYSMAAIVPRPTAQSSFELWVMSYEL